VSTGPVFVETGECREGGTSGQLLLRTGNVHHGYSAGPITLKGGVRDECKALVHDIHFSKEYYDIMIL